MKPLKKCLRSFVGVVKNWKKSTPENTQIDNLNLYEMFVRSEKFCFGRFHG